MLRVRRAIVHSRPRSEEPLYNAARGEQGGEEKDANIRILMRGLMSVF